MARRDRYHWLGTRSETFPFTSRLTGRPSVDLRIFCLRPGISPVATYSLGGRQYDRARHGQRERQERRRHLCNGARMVWLRIPGSSYYRTARHDSEYQSTTTID
jgi:hypothetical protein